MRFATLDLNASPLRPTTQDMNGDMWRPVIAAISAISLTFLALYLVVAMVELFGLWGFWLSVSAAAVFPPWLRLRARLN